MTLHAAPVRVTWPKPSATRLSNRAAVFEHLSPIDCRILGAAFVQMKK